MEYEPVDVYVVAEDTREPVAGVLVRVYTTDGKRVLGEGSTGPTGRVSFLLPGPANYEVRLFKFATGFQQPLLVEVRSDPQTPRTTLNAFEVAATVVRREQSTDIRLCRASGYFRTLTGAPRRQLDIYFTGVFQAMLLEGALVLDERRAARTDDNGFACIDLIRCAEYDASVENYENKLRKVRVPDLPSANLPELLFAYVDSVQVDPLGVSRGATVEVAPLILDSGGTPLPGTARGDVRWKVLDPNIATLQVTDTTLKVTGMALGTTILLAERADNSIVTVPAEPIKGASTVVTVG